jgi:NAD-dependent deacetylase
MTTDEIDVLARALASSRRAIAFTGAGISTESGIPDFRGPNGVWKKVDPAEFTIDNYIRNPEHRARVWGMRAASTEAQPEPNDGHRALAELEHRGWVKAVITQNIDRLHERAGSRALVEVHGSIRTSSCLACGTVVPFAEVVELLPVPGCPNCGRILKPDVVMFGELLPEAAMARALELAATAGLLLVVGSSLEVYPVAGLPLETLAAGGSLAIVNRGSTPFDRRASVTIDGGAGETLRALAGALAERP